MVVGRAFALRRQSVAPPPRRPKETNRRKSRVDSISAMLPRSRRTSDRKSRPSLDFPTAVLEAARRASVRPNTSPRPLEASSTCSSLFEEERQYSSPARRSQINHEVGGRLEMVCSVYQQLEGEDDGIGDDIDVDRALISPTQLLLYAPRIFEDGVVNVSDHKTCALLMTRMKEANRQPSPSQ